MTDSPKYTLGLIFYPGMTSFLAKAGLLEGDVIYAGDDARASYSKLGQTTPIGWGYLLRSSTTLDCVLPPIDTTTNRDLNQ